MLLGSGEIAAEELPDYGRRDERRSPWPQFNIDFDSLGSAVRQRTGVQDCNVKTRNRKTWRCRSDWRTSNRKFNTWCAWRWITRRWGTCSQQAVGRPRFRWARTV